MFSETPNFSQTIGMTEIRGHPIVKAFLEFFAEQAARAADVRVLFGGLRGNISGSKTSLKFTISQAAGAMVFCRILMLRR